ncbi:alpha/beta hydrolase [Corynebacterium uropygiale]|uniref:Alpha/beta hydrolase n=1 Tax=Corynebacterium uropygiale TaxID=1775911 RepID=A0A9X1QNU1_9CORY|nr:alpha/beta hydrolase [Corynebacterium uropygiale]MCF4006076.1 alpha/beta hydrolase [Corynebacterium uropygiale]
MTRPITDDAWTALRPFREAGAVSFHRVPLDEVRENYIASCERNGLKDEDPHVTDYRVEDFQVRYYEPRPLEERSQPTTAILFIHGGGWLMGNLETHHSAARRLALETGFPLVAVDYRLAPEHPYPAAIEDCRTAYRWLSDPDAEHGLSVSSICVLGDSAGGQLAAILATERAQSEDTSLAPTSSQVLLYPITDVTEEHLDTSASYQRVTEGFPLVADTMRWFIDTYVPEGQDRSVPDLSPARHPLPEGLPPAYVLTVDNDPLADEGGAYALALARAGVDVTYRHLSGYHHGLFTSAGIIRQGERSLHDVAEFIRRTSC